VEVSAEVAQSVAALKLQWARLFERASKPACCVSCGALRIWFNGHRKRSASVTVEGGHVIYLSEVRCRRVKCADCRLSWTLRPAGLVPHKHYQPCVVATVLGRYLFDKSSTMQTVAAGAGCSRRTVSRWLRWVGQLGEPAVLLRKLIEATDTVIVPRVRAIAKPQGPHLSRAAEMLGLFEHLASAYGLEPPGLRGVLCSVIGERSHLATYARPCIPGLARSQGP
jgi:hypothetical protein